MSQEINLLQVRRAPGAFRATSANTMALVLMAAAVLAALLAVYENYRLQAVQREAQAVERAVKEARAAHEKALAERNARKPDGSPDARLAELDGQLFSRQQVLEALKSGVVGTTAGFSEYMLALSRQGMTGVWLTAFDFAAGGNDLTLSGRALSPDLVPVYLQRLTQEAPLQGRQFASMVISQPTRGSDSGDAGKGTRVAPAYIEFEISSGASGRTSPQPAGSLPPPPITPDAVLGGGAKTGATK